MRKKEDTVYSCSLFSVPKALYVYTLYAYRMCKTYSVVPMLALMLFLLFLYSSAITRKQSVGSQTYC